MKEGYRYKGEVYEVEALYWFDGNADLHDSYVAIVTDGGTFYESYARVIEPEVFVYTKNEFETWYAQYMRDLETGPGAPLRGGGNFASFLRANGFTPRYGEAQGVTRRVLTYGGIGLVSAAIVGGSAYLIVRHKRKKKAAMLEIAEAER
jgi:hypothetical protein